MKKRGLLPADPSEIRDLLDDIQYYEVKLTHARSDAVQRYRDMKREKVREIIDRTHAYAICGGGGKRFHTRTPDGRQIYATQLDDLYDKLYEYYYGEQEATIGALFEPYIAWKQELRGLQGGTVKRERNVFKKYIRDSDLAAMKIKNVKASDVERFFTG